jgi:hypothetical protein
MSIYRLYVLNDVERVENSLEEEFPDDAAALDRAAASLCGEKAVEVWAGERLVARLGREFNV